MNKFIDILTKIIKTISILLPIIGMGIHQVGDIWKGKNN